jgi:hypothetical protein
VGDPLVMGVSVTVGIGVVSASAPGTLQASAARISAASAMLKTNLEEGLRAFIIPSLSKAA